MKTSYIIDAQLSHTIRASIQTIQIVQ